MKRSPPIEGVRQALDYDPATGLLTWKSWAGEGRAVNVRNSRYAGRTAGTPHKDGYVLVHVCGLGMLAHRIAFALHNGRWPEGDIDHANGDRADNRIANLREATRSLNNANQRLRSANTSGFKGVYWNKERQRWQAQIKVNGIRRQLGRFDSPETAHRAYMAAAVAAFGSFARAA